MKKIVFMFLLVVILHFFILADEVPPKRIYRTRHINPHPPKIDGKLNDEVWQKGDWATGFIQRIPYEGKKPSQDTSFKILYDQKNLYIIVRAWDAQPEKIVRRMSRRDNIDGDSISINIDSYYDQQTAFCFTVAASGAKGDVLISENGRNEDSNWDPVWVAKTRVDDKGWVAEIKIPFSQLRFGKQNDQTWGLQVSRHIFRCKEESGWQLIPQNAPGIVHHFGMLKGLNGIKQGRRIELLPYAVAKTQQYQPEAGNPFAPGKSSSMMGGLDGKIGLTSDLTLDFTVNPDFGQVEADPSQVNLTAFETYFEEKRPFFIEGNNILNYKIMMGDGDFGWDNLFYSRRIGRRPQYNPETSDDQYVDMPGNTSILAAMKVTGKTKNGLSIGIIDSLTRAESAVIGNLDQRYNEKVEPFTNYFGLRLQQDINKGQTTLGAMVTAVNRDINEDQLNFLHKSAYTGGFDFSHSWKNRTYTVWVKGIFSRVAGDEEAILNTQESPQRYYQRPDAEHLELDPTRTSLSGHGGDLMFGKLGGGKTRFAIGFTWRSPGLELNDMGYLREADVMMQWVWAAYRITKPFAIFRSLNFNFNEWQGWDFSPAKIFQGGNLGTYGEFKNFWTFSLGTSIQGKSLQRSILRGGPSVLTPGGYSSWLSLGTDRRKKIQLNVSGSMGARYGYYFIRSASAGFTYRPSSSLSISASPTIQIAERELQYLDAFDVNQTTQYLLGAIDQTTYALTLRLNYCITPELSIQFYGQPFISTGEYTNFKNITNPRADDFKQTYHTYLPQQINFNGQENIYTIDHDGDGNTDYEFENPNFNFLQFRCNLVVRWEYQAGSSLYLVWTQSRTDVMEETGYSMGENFHNLFDTHPHNVFLIKIAHRFNL